MLRLFIGLIAYILCSRRELLLEILALRQWLNVFKAGHSRPRLYAPDRVFWVALRRLAGVEARAVIVQPETVVAWHRAGFKLYWTWRSSS